MFKQFQQTIARRRRALFNVPGSDVRKLQKVPSLKADSIVLDLEDGVPLSKKNEARQLVCDALQTLKFPVNAERAVRINAVDSGLEEDDLRALANCDRLEAIVLPKVNNAEHVKFVASKLGKDVEILACIESAEALINIREICLSDPRIDALIFASEDYCADTGISRTDDLQTLLYARSMVVTYAKAFGKQAIDIVCIDYKSQDKLKSECLDGKNLGFTGKQAIHPGQIELIQNLFVPSEKEVSLAAKIVQGYKEHSEKGLGAFDVEGKVVDLPVLKSALRTLANAGRTDLLE